MRKNISPSWQIPELFYSALTFALLLFFTYGIFVRAPYIGFYFDPADGRILQIFAPSESLWQDILTHSFGLGDSIPADPASLQMGDLLLQVGDVSLEEYHENRMQELFNNIKGGETTDIIVNRNGKIVTVQWKIPGFNQLEFFSRFFNIWWLAYAFWFVGFAAQIFVRPKDARWRLLVAFNYLTGLWVILGALSARQIWGSSILMHAVTWILLPVYLHFHWLFPQPLKPVRRTMTATFHVACLLLALGELFQILPRTLYMFGFLFALIGSVVLQAIHFIKRPRHRRAVGFVAVAILLAVLPSIALSISSATGIMPQITILGMITLPFMPLAYLFVIYRSQLSDLEMRANRFVSLYAFLIILGTILIAIITPALSLRIPGNITLLLSLGVTLLISFVSILVFPAFQSFVEERLLGIKLPYLNLQEMYSGRITTSISIPGLLQILEEEVFPSLLVRQYAFMQVINGGLKTLLVKNVSEEQLSHRCTVDELTAHAKKFSVDTFPCDWVRLILPLKVGDHFIGFWLLGQRDPDDYYPQAEIPILQSLANQTAIALSNILHAEQLRKMYQSDVERYEKERMRLALELHDSVLNELAVLRTNLNEVNVSPQFQTSYEEVTHRLREIVTDLRPPMLMYGLIPAVNELADNLMERTGDRVTIKVGINTSEERLPQNIEQHLFRIVQESCENSLRHARAKNINIFGRLAPGKVELDIADDGIGFDPQTELSSLIANSHFGLAGMVERASLIGAEISIQSNLNAGTKVHITWAGEAEKS